MTDDTQQHEEKFTSRYGDITLDDYGYVTIPGWILRNLIHLTHVGITEELDEHNQHVKWILEHPDQGKRKKMTDTEFGFFTRVMSFKYDSRNGTAQPSIGRISAMWGKTVQSVRNAKNSMVDKGWLTIIERPGYTNIYDFSELIRQCKLWEEFWAEHDPDDLRFIESQNDPERILGGTDLIEKFRGSKILEGTPQRILGRRNRIKSNNRKELRSFETIASAHKENSSNTTRKPKRSSLSKRRNRKTITSGDVKQVTPDIKNPSKQLTDEQIGGTLVSSKGKTPGNKAMIEWVKALLRVQGIDDQFFTGKKEDWKKREYGKAVKVASDLKRVTDERAEATGIIVSYDTVPDIMDWLINPNRKDGKQFPTATINTITTYILEYIDNVANKQQNKHDQQIDIKKQWEDKYGIPKNK